MSEHDENAFNSQGITGNEDIIVNFIAVTKYDDEWRESKPFSCRFATWQDVDIYKRENSCSTQYFKEQQNE